MIYLTHSGCVVLLVMVDFLIVILFFATSQKTHLTNVIWLSSVAMVRKEIQDETDRMTGRTKQISPVPIHLSIYSPNGLFFFSSLATYAFRKYIFYFKSKHLSIFLDKTILNDWNIYIAFVFGYLLYIFVFLALILGLPHLAVVNLTLIDLPGLTKVAVGKLDLLFLILMYPWCMFFCLHHSLTEIVVLTRGAAWEYCWRYWRHGSNLCWEGNWEISFYLEKSWIIFNKLLHFHLEEIHRGYIIQLFC